MNIIEAMKERKSVRSFDGTGLTTEQKNSLKKTIEESYSPFGGNVTIRLKEFNLKEGYKPSTYGMIKGAENFFLLGIGNDEASALSAGFRFEQVVLKAWQLGLGTCWIAATFKGSDFDNGELWPEGEELKIICPVGKPAKQRMLEKVGRMAMGSNKRKPFDDTYFYKDFKTAVPENNTFREALELMRLAPSSTNSQPWRALVEDNIVHFYYKPKSQCSVLDTGIGICQFYETEKFNGNDGNFSKIHNVPTPPEDWKYLISYTRK